MLVAARPLVLVGLTAGLLGGCSSGSGSDLSTEDVAGDWTQPGSDPVVHLELAQDGSVSGSDGCNQLTGSWELDGTTVQLGDLGATMMACEDVDTWLSQAQSATVSGDTLTVLDESGDSIGTLEKS